MYNVIQISRYNHKLRLLGKIYLDYEKGNIAQQYDSGLHKYGKPSPLCEYS